MLEGPVKNFFPEKNSEKYVVYDDSISMLIRMNTMDIFPHIYTRDNTDFCNI
jgi:hypothetical protein